MTVTPTATPARGGKALLPGRRAFQTIRPAVKEDGTVRYRAAKADCAPCPLKLAHLKRILGITRLRLRGPTGRRTSS